MVVLEGFRLERGHVRCLLQTSGQVVLTALLGGGSGEGGEPSGMN